MSCSSFRANTNIQIGIYKYVLKSKINSETWQLQDCKTFLLKEYSERKLQELYILGELRFEDGLVSNSDVDLSNKFAAHEFSEVEWRALKRKRAYVISVLNIPAPESVMTPAIENMARQLGESEKPHWITVCRWKKKYIASESDIRSLGVNEKKRGNRSPRYPDEVIRLVKEGIDKFYMTREQKNVQQVLDLIRAQVLRENKLRPDSMVLPIPELRLIRRLIDAIPAFDRSLARDGREAANKKYRSVLSHRITQAPLERAEIDHTQLDLMVVDGNGFPRGRPWLTVCLDDYSRSILGIVIGFEPPSFRTVAQCLKSAILPKVELKSNFSEILNDWHAHGIMRELVVDNGVEFHSTSLENACYALGIEIHYSARKTPWFKGKIERLLGTLNSQVAHGNPGTTFSNIFEKDDYDPVSHAIIRFETLKLLINKWVADVYHQETHRTLGASPALVWVNSIDASDILLPDNIAQLDALLGHTEKRILTHKGIEFSGLLYNSSELTELRRRLGNKLKVEIRVDESNLGAIVVLSPDKRQMFLVPALRREYANGLSMFQHSMCKKYAWKNFGKNDELSCLEAKLAIAEIIEGESKSGRKKQRAKVARYQGDGILRQEDAPLVLDVPAKFIPGESDISETMPGQPSFKNSNVDGRQRMFKPIFRERISESDQIHCDGDNING